ncbi:DUF2249 domain-containing protein [Inhella crocodyli]|nr:DUF2249 domain-containing protein [Inhella crocodyli]
MTVLDLRSAPLRERHRPVFAALDGLTVGEHLELCDDRELQSLHHLLQAARSGVFEWDRLEAAPGEWRVALRKTSEALGCAACACACGGARAGGC